jgi:Ca2+-binding EF-hand superfamily protein
MRVPPAFSEESLELSMVEGTIDEESYTLLKTFSASKSNVSQYMSSTKGTILLRNPTLSTSIELPVLQGMRRAEIAFGPQKDYYRNAELVLNDRDNLNKEKMRNAITLGRIEHNVKKIGSMMHLLNPLQVDDVKIPLDNKAKEYNAKMEAEDKRMQVRLLESASSVPLAADDEDDALSGPSKLHKIHHNSLNKFRSSKLLKEAQNEAKAAEAARAGTAAWDYEKPAETVIDSRYKNNINFLNQLGNTRRPLDRSGVTGVVSKIEEASDLKYHEKYDLQYAYSASGIGGQVQKHNLPQAAKEALEKKVRQAVKDEYNERIRIEQMQERKARAQADVESSREFEIGHDEDDDESQGSPSRPATTGREAHGSPTNKVVLDTRSLLPFYKAEDVRHFMDIFVKVDEDFSGDLDMEEWVKLFSSINNSIPEQEARSIFMKFKNEKGVLTVNELIPVVFSKATKDQQKLITKFCLAEIMRPENEKTVLTLAEVDQMFEIYDVENVGFVSMGFIRDKAREWPLNENIIQGFLNTIKDVDDDEMVNHREFGRMFKHLVSKAEIVAQRDEELRAERDSNKDKKGKGRR